MNTYAAGQIWKYRTRPGEESSQLYIAKVDRLPQELAFHIYLDALHLKNPRGGEQSSLTHAPVSERTLKASVTSLVAEHAQVPYVSEGYNIWREAYDRGEAGIFDISVAEVVQFIEEIANGTGRDA
jgi:hypothetical protein